MRHLTIGFMLDWRTLNIDSRLGWMTLLSHLLNAPIAAVMIMWIVSIHVPLPSSRCRVAEHTRTEPCFASSVLSCICYAHMPMLMISTMGLHTACVQPAAATRFSLAGSACRLLLMLAGPLLQVERAKKCLDFASTVYILHLAACWSFSGFPSSMSW